MNTNYNELKAAIGKLLGWEVRDFELIRSGRKGGRPNWEVERYDAKRGENRFAFTAFDTNDIYDVHKVC